MGEAAAFRRAMEGFCFSGVPLVHEGGERNAVCSEELSTVHRTASNRNIQCRHHTGRGPGQGRIGVPGKPVRGRRRGLASRAREGKRYKFGRDSEARQVLDDLVDVGEATAAGFQHGQERLAESGELSHVVLPKQAELPDEAAGSSEVPCRERVADVRVGPDVFRHDGGVRIDAPGTVACEAQGVGVVGAQLATTPVAVSQRLLMHVRPPCE